MKIQTSLLSIASLAGAALSLSVATQAWSATAQVGVLKCDTSIGIGEILTASRR